MNFYESINKIETLLNTENSEIIEDEKSYSFYNKLPTNIFENILSINIQELFQYFGDSIWLSISTEALGNTMYTQEKGIDFFSEGVKDIIDQESEVTVIININKDKFVKNLIPQNIFDAYCIRIFSSTTNFYYFVINNTINHLEDTLFKYNYKSLLIISEFSELYKNAATTILGEKEFDQITKLLVEESAFTLAEDVEKAIDLRDKEIKLQNKTQFITPDYFYFNDISNTEIRKAFQSKTIDCVLTFLADNVKIIKDKYVCQFNGYKNVNIILNNNGIDYKTDKVEYLFNLYKWVYESCSQDKLMITRNIISKYLKDDDNVNYIELLTNIEEISQVIKYNYSVFFQGKIDSFFEDRKKIAEYTYEKVNSIENAISSLTEAMTKNIITAIGVILAGIITNAMEKKLTTVPLRFSLFAFLIYLFVSVIYNIITPFISVSQLNNSNSHLIKYYTAFLPNEEIKNIQGDILEKKMCYFKVYWYISVILMIGLIFATIYSIINLDVLIHLFN